MDGGFGDATPSYSSQAIASFPCPKYLFDAAPYTVDWLAPFVELSQCRLFVAAPRARGDNARYSTLCKNSLTEMASAIGAVRKYLAGITGQCIGACSAVVDVGGCDCNFFDQRCVGIGADMCLEAVQSRLTLVFDPARIIIALASRRNIVASTNVPVLTVIALALSCAVTVVNNSRPCWFAFCTGMDLSKNTRDPVPVYQTGKIIKR